MDKRKPTKKDIEGMTTKQLADQFTWLEVSADIDHPKWGAGIRADLHQACVNACEKVGLQGQAGKLVELILTNAKNARKAAEKLPDFNPEDPTKVALEPLLAKLSGVPTDRPRLNSGLQRSMSAVKRQKAQGKKNHRKNKQAKRSRRKNRKK